MRVACVITLSIAATGLMSAAGAQQQPGTATDASRATRVDPMTNLARTPAPPVTGPITLRELFRRITAISGVTVTGLWQGRHAGSHLDPEATVNLKGPFETCADLLEAALDQVASDEPLDWQVSRSGIEVGPHAALWRPAALQARVYDVSDLLLLVPAFRSTGIPQPGAGASGGGGSSSGSGSGASGGSGGQGAGPAPDPGVQPSKDARRDEIAALIQRHVVPEAWEANGGPCTITPHDATLIIRAPAFVHRRIASPTTERRRPGPPPERVGPPKSSP